jgi:SAM-dependent methyltransferase
MSAGDRAFVGSIPEIYERYLGPMLFEPYADELAGRLSGFRGAILETAAGTGRLTRALIRSVAPGSAITATDLNEPMLARAAEEVRSDLVSWQPADAMNLPFNNGRFDAVVCQFGVMFFPDKIKAFKEAHRVLRPGKAFLFNVWHDLPQNELSFIADQTVAKCFPSNPPGFLRRGPWGYQDRAVIEQDLRAAGFKKIAFEIINIETPANSAAEAALGLCKGSPLRAEIEERDPGRLDAVVEAVSQALRAQFGEGPIRGKGQALVVTAVT